VFAGVKILIAEAWKLPIVLSLGVIVAILAIVAIVATRSPTGRIRAAGGPRTAGRP